MLSIQIEAEHSDYITQSSSINTVFIYNMICICGRSDIHEETKIQ